MTIVIIFLNKIDGYLISEGNNASSNIGRFGIESDEKICETAWKQVVDKLTNIFHTESKCVIRDQCTIILILTKMSQVLQRSIAPWLLTTILQFGIIL